MSFVQQTEENGVVTWTISRPDRFNALGSSVANELNQLIRKFEQNPLALVIKAQSVQKKGRRIWIAGGDLKELAILDAGGVRTYIEQMSFFVTELTRLPCPVITVVDGEAIGGGAELALAGDIRLASTQSNWHFKQLDVGLATGYASAGRLIDLVGLSAAQHLLFGGRKINTDVALQLGVLHEHVPSDELNNKLVSWLDRFRRLGLDALAAQKRMLQASSTAHPGSRPAYENSLFLDLWRNPAHKEFLDSFHQPKSGSKT